MQTHPRRSGREAKALLSLALVGCLGCGAEPGPAAEELNVLLVVVDTLGAEHLGSYGGPARTPHLDQLAAQGLRFEQAVATAPWTQPSIASLLTSLMPSQHGVERLGQSLGDEPLTLAEALKERHGLRTHGVVSHVLLLPKNGYAQGFDGYDSQPAGGHDDLSSAEVTDAAIEFIDQHRAGSSAEERFFLFAHYFDPHYVYRSHEDFKHAPEYQGPIRPGMPIWDLRDQRDELGAEDVDFLRALYHEEIAYTDHHIGRLLQHLERTGLERNTLVVFTADHGEEFMGHGWIGHTRTLYDELVRVPLIMRLPGAIEPGVVTAPVSLIDVAPSVLELLGPEVPAEWQGQSLLPYMANPGFDAGPRLVFSEVSYGPKRDVDKPQAMQKRAHKTALVVGDVKLIHDRLSDGWELYRRADDPGEQRDLLREDPEAAASLGALKSKLLAFEAARGAGSQGDIEFEESELEELRKLGYLRGED